MQFPKWKTTKAGDTIVKNGRTHNWCKWHNRYVISHSSADCRENPAHPDYEENQKKKNGAGKPKPDLEMNLMTQNEDCAPINPWISLASSSITDAASEGDIEQAMPTTAAKKMKVEEDVASEEPTESKTYACGPHTSFWGHFS